eukprot:TRINITY_DN1402_c0_g1_i1.p1 TRINITY_DN1402_c0_g1~~TRINITY_DN1402_c0_g1_i1.p1  ORF type:complete len:314 (+),score=34.14 TRINITY_DN1402_c0_g1_i1:103-1044(+)
MVVDNSPDIPAAAILDILLWLSSIVVFVYLIKIPIELYFLTGKKLSYTQSLKKSDPVAIYEMKSMQEKLFKLCMVTPFLSLIAWFGTDSIIESYRLTVESTLIRPYFVVLVSLLLALIPVRSLFHYFRRSVADVADKHTQLEIDVIYSEKELKGAYKSMEKNHQSLQNLRIKLKNLSDSNSELLKLEYEITSLRRELKQGEEEKDLINRVQDRLRHLEKITERAQISINGVEDVISKQDHHSVLDTLVRHTPSRLSVIFSRWRSLSCTLFIKSFSSSPCFNSLLKEVISYSSLVNSELLSDKFFNFIRRFCRD